jgi:hypothetical protein
MSALRLTRHAILRMSQRGIRLDDVELVETFGTEVEGAHLVRQKDAQAIEREAKKLITRIRRLVGKRVVRNGGSIVTAYHAGRAKQRRLLRRGYGGG